MGRDVPALQLEQFRNTYRHFESSERWLFLDKKPFEHVLPVYTNSETAVADLFAWVESHKNEVSSPRWKQSALQLPHKRQWMDKTNPHDVNRLREDSWKTWKISKRRITR